MHDESGDELRSLRERAYGPNADIQGDAAAIARLHELESHAIRVAPVAVEDPRDETEGETDAAPSAAADSELFPAEVEPAAEPADVEPGQPAADTPELTDPDAAPEAAASGTESAAAPTQRGRRRGTLFWAGALILALLVGAGLSYTTMKQNPGNVGVLSVDPDAEFPNSMGDETPGSKVFEQFHGLTVLLVPQNWGTGNPAPCLFILPGSRDAAIIGAGCGAGEFDPTAAVGVTSGLPDELLERFPEGSALQFVLRDGEVVVYSDAG